MDRAHIHCATIVRSISGRSSGALWYGPGDAWTGLRLSVVLAGEDAGLQPLGPRNKVGMGRVRGCLDRVAPSRGGCLLQSSGWWIRGGTIVFALS